MRHYRTGRDARPGTEWGAPAPDLPAGLPSTRAPFPPLAAGCRGQLRAANERPAPHPGAGGPSGGGAGWSVGRWVVGRVVRVGRLPALVQAV